MCKPLYSNSVYFDVYYRFGSFVSKDKDRLDDSKDKYGVVKSRNKNDKERSKLAETCKCVKNIVLLIL